MNTKICSKCKIEKPIDEFSKDKNRKDNKYIYCKICQRKELKKHYENNKEKIKLKHKKYYEDNKEKEHKRSKKYYEEHKEEINIKNNEYNKNHKDERKLYKKHYDDTHKEEKAIYGNYYYNTHKEEIKEYNRLYLKTNNGKKLDRRKKSKRNRNLGFIPLNNTQLNHDSHHIDKDYIINIPKDLHQKYRHNHKKSDTMIEINKLAFEYLYSNPLNINYDNLDKYYKE